MSMGFEDIRIAIESRLAVWNGVPVAYDNVPTQPSVQAAQDARESWVRLTLVPGDTLTAAIGDGPKARHTGLLMMQVFTAENVSSASAMQLADSLAQHVQYWQAGHLSTQAASLTRAGHQNGWYMVTVSAPYRAD